MTRMLWHSNAPWSPTGYGNQTGLFLPHLKEHYDVACSAFYGLEGAPRAWKGIITLPGLGHQDYGNLYLPSHANFHFGGDPRGGIVVTLMDVWVLNPQMASQVNMACWVPVDHEPAPPAVKSFFAESGAVPIAMTRFGQEMLTGLDPLYVPHGVDCDVFKATEKTDARHARFPEDAFVVGMVAANKGAPSRKSFAQAFQAFKRISDAHDNAFLYLHTTLDPGFGHGENLPAMIRELDIPMDRIRIADQYQMKYAPYADEDMAKIYSAMDCLLNPSTGEGFGIPVLEAQACGTPAIVTDATAMREVCGAGWRVKHTPLWTAQKSWQFTPDVDDIVAALEECHGLQDSQRKQLSKDARRHAEAYDVRKVTEDYWLPVLREVESRFDARKPVKLKAAA